MAHKILHGFSLPEAKSKIFVRKMYEISSGEALS
jgi:hypothetical protein